MGGLPCLVDARATLRFTAVPTEPTQLAAFDAQVRELYGHPGINQSVVNDVEEKIPSLVTRIELMAFMQEMKEERLRMHKENLDNGIATRSDIRAVHERVDALFRNGHAR
jgi:hypothetical protein